MNVYSNTIQQGAILYSPAPNSVMVGGYAIISDGPSDGLTGDDFQLSTTLGECWLSPTANLGAREWHCIYNSMPAGNRENIISVAATTVPEDSCSGHFVHSFVWDEDPPTVSISPDPGAAGDGVLSSADTLRATGQDDLGIDYVYLEVAADGERRVKRGAGPSVALTGLAGDATVTAMAYDLVGRSRAVTRSFIIDSEPPKVAILSALSLEHETGVGTVFGTASDDGGLASGSIRIQDEGTGAYWDGSAFVPGVQSLSIGTLSGKQESWGYSGLSTAAMPVEGGVWIVTVEAVDLVGRTGTATARIIIKPRQVIRVPTPPQPCSGGSERLADVTIGDGTNVTTGEGSVQSLLYVHRPNSPGLYAATSHDSMGPADSVWGYGWRMAHEHKIELRSDGSALWTDGGGAVKLFQPNPLEPGKFLSPVNTYISLRMSGDGLYLLDKDGTGIGFAKALPLPAAPYVPSTLIDRNGNTITYTWEEGRLTRVQDVYGRYFSIGYDPQGKVASIEDSGDRVPITFTYDPVTGDKKTETGPAGTIQYDYDEGHRITRIGYPNGGSRHWEYDAKGRVLAEWDELDLGGQANRRTYAYFASSTTVADGLGRTTVYRYAKKRGLRRLTRIELIGAGKTEADAVLVSSFTYDENMNLLGQWDAMDHGTHYTYDGNGNVTTMSDPDGQPTAVTYDPTYNKPTYVQPPLGAPASLEYNPVTGDLMRVTVGQSETRLEYNAGYGHLSDVYDALDNHTQFEYDANGGWLKAVVAPLGRRTDIVQDGAGRVRQVSDPILGMARWTYYDYDDEGNLLGVRDAANGLTSYSYSPGRKGSLLSKVVDARQNAGSRYGTEFFYDKAGRLERVRNQKGGERTFRYDTESNLIQVDNPDPLKSPILFEYDDFNRLIKKTLPTGEWVDYGYDAAGNQTQAGTIETTYDSMDRPKTVVQRHVPSAPMLSYTYDGNGNRKTMGTPWGGFSYDYDAQNRLIQLASPSGTFTFEYDLAGKMTLLRFPNGVEAGYGYDEAGQSTAVFHARGSVVVASSTYVYDNAGNRVVKVDMWGSHDYGYDVLQRLVSVYNYGPESPVGAYEGFGYDGVGNRTMDRFGTDFAYDDANRIVRDNEYVYGHDLHGNLISATNRWLSNQTTTYVYNSEDKLIEAHLPDGKVWEYKYDARGRRIEKSLSGDASKTLKYVYDGDDILALLDGMDNLLALFTHGPGLGRPLAMRQLGTTDFYYHADALGSVMALTNSGGQVVESYEYTAFGETYVRDAAGTLRGMTAVGNLIAYAGTVRDWETGLNCMTFRCMDPYTGRFTQEDPIGFAGGDVNLFAFVWNQPTNQSDFMGLLSDEQLWNRTGRWRKMVSEAISNTPGVKRARADICRAGGKAAQPLYRRNYERQTRNPPWEALTPEGRALRNTENYLYAYYAIQEGALGEDLAYTTLFFGIPLRQVYKAIREAVSPGSFAHSPASFEVVQVGFAGANDAYRGGLSCECTQ